MENVIYLLAVIILLVIFFYLFCLCVKLYTGCTMDEAIKKVQSFFKTDIPYHIAADIGLSNDLDNTLHSIIGDAAYSKLLGLSRQTNIIQSGTMNGLRCIGIVVPYSSANEKIQAENLFRGILVRYLTIHGFDNRVHTSWSIHSGLNLTAIFLEYAETKEESEILSRTIQVESQKTVKQFKPPVDEDIDND